MARSVAGGAHSPYAAAVALESWFRTGGGFAYNQHPPRTRGKPVLVDFVDAYARRLLPALRRRDGADAALPRGAGHGSRPASASGTYDAKRPWTVTDHDAHAWVEVWFRGYGWLPFDPTPSRGGVAGAYSASSRRLQPAPWRPPSLGGHGRSRRRRATAASGSASPARQTKVSADVPAFARPGEGDADRRPRVGRAEPAAPARPAARGAGRPDRGSRKLALRRARYLTRDPRRLAAACRRELADYPRRPADRGLARSATLAELAALVAARARRRARRRSSLPRPPRASGRPRARARPRGERAELRALLRRSMRRELSLRERAARAALPALARLLSVSLVRRRDGGRRGHGAFGRSPSAGRSRSCRSTAGP